MPGGVSQWKIRFGYCVCWPDTVQTVANETLTTVILAVAGVVPLKVAVITTSFAVWLCWSGVIVTLPGVPSVRLSAATLSETLPAGEAESWTVPDAPWRIICAGIVCPRMVMSSLVIEVLLILTVETVAGT